MSQNDEKKQSNELTEDNLEHVAGGTTIPGIPAVINTIATIKPPFGGGAESLPGGTGPTFPQVQNTRAGI